MVGYGAMRIYGRRGWLKLLPEYRGGAVMILLRLVTRRELQSGNLTKLVVPA